MLHDTAWIERGIFLRNAPDEAPEAATADNALDGYRLGHDSTLHRPAFAGRMLMPRSNTPRGFWCAPLKTVYLPSRIGFRKPPIVRVKYQVPRIETTGWLTSCRRRNMKGAPRRAVVATQPGHRPKHQQKMTDARPPMNVKAKIGLREGVPERINSVLRPKEKRAAFIREAIEKELKRRETKLKPRRLQMKTSGV